jgi:hypothetical protein
MGESAGPGTVMRKTLFPRAAIKAAFVEGRAEGRFGEPLFPERSFRGLADQKIDLFLQEVQLLLHFFDQRYDIRVSGRRKGVVVRFIGMFGHFSAPLTSRFSLKA